jgi:hypothetical protein
MYVQIQWGDRSNKANEENYGSRTVGYDKGRGPRAEQIAAPR